MNFQVSVTHGKTSYSVTMVDEFDKWEAMRRAVDRVAREQNICATKLGVDGCREIA